MTLSSSDILSCSKCNFCFSFWSVSALSNLDLSFNLSLLSTYFPYKIAVILRKTMLSSIRIDCSPCLLNASYWVWMVSITSFIFPNNLSKKFITIVAIVCSCWILVRVFKSTFWASIWRVLDCKLSTPSRNSDVINTTALWGLLSMWRTTASIIEICRL